MKQNLIGGHPDTPDPSKHHLVPPNESRRDWASNGCVGVMIHFVQNCLPQFTKLLNLDIRSMDLRNKQYGGLIRPKYKQFGLEINLYVVQVKNHLKFDL